jgi:hypothetical protein
MLSRAVPNELSFKKDKPNEKLGALAANSKVLNGAKA